MTRMKCIRSNRRLQTQFARSWFGPSSYIPHKATIQSDPSQLWQSFMANHQHWFPRTVHKTSINDDLAAQISLLNLFGKVIWPIMSVGYIQPYISFRHEMWWGAQPSFLLCSTLLCKQMPSRDYLNLHC